MAKIVRVVQPEVTAKVKRRVWHVPLALRLMGVAILALAPLTALLLFYNWQSANTSLDLFAICAAVLGCGLAYAAGDEMFIRPIRNLRTWLEKVQQNGLAHAPMFPELGSDEIGALGRDISTMSAKFLGTFERNKDLAGEKSIFLSVAAHQLRTPMTDLTWSIEELLEPATPEDTRRTLLQGLDVSLKRALLIINHIVASAKIEEGRFGYVMAMVDIVPAVESLIAQFKPIADDRGITLSLEHEAVPKVYADEERISLALFDLLSNAIDYTPHGGRVTVSIKPENADVELSIADTGIGIPEKELPFLFTKFRRGDNARHMRPNGSGLGLYLVKNIIDNHHSHIRVESDESAGGSKFSFVLPTKAAN